MTLDIGTRIRTLVDCLDLDGYEVPARTSGAVIGHQGEKLLVEFHDAETDTHYTAVLERWEVLRVKS